MLRAERAFPVGGSAVGANRPRLPSIAVVSTFLTPTSSIHLFLWYFFMAISCPGAQHAKTAMSLISGVQTTLLHSRRPYQAQGYVGFRGGGGCCSFFRLFY